MDRAATDSGNLFTNLAKAARRNRADVLLAILGFFLGRAQIFGTLSPMAVAAAVPVFLGGGVFYLYAAFALLGLATRFSAAYTIKYFIAIGIMWFANVCFSGRVKKQWELTKCAIAGCVMLLSGLLPEVLKGFSVYGLTVALLEGVLAFSLSYILCRGRVMLIEEHKGMAAEEFLSAAFYIGGVIMGAADVWVGWVSLRYLSCAFLVLTASIRAGGAAAAAAGIVLGTLMHASGFEHTGFAVALGVSGLLCGFLRNVPKLAQGAVFASAMTLASLYFGLFRVELALSVVLAALLYAVLPVGRLLAGAREVLTPATINAAEYYGRVRDMAAGKLRASAGAFTRLSKSFDGLYEPRAGLMKNEVDSLIDDVINDTCHGCSKAALCWERDALDCYQKTYALLKLNDPNIPRDESDKGPALDFCIKSELLRENALKYFELYKNDLKWMNYLDESRNMAASHLSAAAGIVSSLAANLEFTGKFDFNLEKKVKTALLKHGIEPDNVLVVRGKDGRYEAEITHKPCGMRRKCVTDAVPVISSVLGRPMKKCMPECYAGHTDGKYVCRIKLEEERKLSVSFGVALEAAAKSGCSGDSFSHMDNIDGQAVLILSDGMGTGKAARAESQATVELFEGFVESGFDKSLAVRLINSALLLKSTSLSKEENFATLDVCSIDLRDGRTEFLKVGASPSYIISGDAVEAIRSYSLPIGILDSVEPETARRQVKSGDIIVMMTDGVMDGRAGMSDARAEAWLAAAVKKISDPNPQNIADLLLSETINEPASLRQSGAKDDMTILVARIW